MGIVTDVFEVVGQALTEFVGALGDGITSVTALFYNTESGFTFLGVLLLISAGIGLVYFIVRLIMRLVARSA